MKTSRASAEIGLCEDCEHVRRLENRKGHSFYRCDMSKRDDRFLAYPPLPVEACLGYAPDRRSELQQPDDT